MGKKKLTYTFVKNRFEEDNYILLSDRYVNCSTKLKYRCPKGHEHSISWVNWQQGHRCPYCDGQAKPTIGFVRKSFEDSGYKLLTTVYINSDSHLEYICPRGHKHSMIWSNWRTGRRCPYCKAEKHSKRMLGSLNYNWKGGVTKFNKELRNFIKTIKWGNEVFKRDNYTCKKCKNRGGKLVAHHIIPLQYIKEYFNINNIEAAKKCEMFYDISNGVTLCEDCHKEYHKKITGGIKNYGRQNLWRSKMVSK